MKNFKRKLLDFAGYHPGSSFGAVSLFLFICILFPVSTIFMRLFKAFSIVTLLAIVVTSCKENLPTIITRNGLPVDGSQEVPAKAVAGTGSIDISYNQSTRILSYTVTWSNLTGPVSGMHIHGTASKGFNAPILQNFSTYPKEPAGSYSGTLLIDGVVFKEENLFRGAYYINIHTAANPGGEIRGQIVF